MPDPITGSVTAPADSKEVDKKDAVEIFHEDKGTGNPAEERDETSSSDQKEARVGEETIPTPQNQEGEVVYVKGHPVIRTGNCLPQHRSCCHH